MICMKELINFNKIILIKSEIVRDNWYRIVLLFEITKRLEGREGMGGWAGATEQLLLTNKSLTNLTTILTQLVGVIVGI